VSGAVIVSYDGTANDDDALVLAAGLIRGAGGAPKADATASGPAPFGVLTLAYVRHSRELDPRREALAQFDAERRLRSGLALLDGPAAEVRVLFSASTADGLTDLAAATSAPVIVFGSDYRTAPGRAEPGASAQRLLDGAGTAIAVARAGLRLSRERPLGTVAAVNPQDDPAVEATVSLLMQRHGVRRVSPETDGIDLLVVGSRPGARAGRVALSGQTRAALNGARGSVLVLARERPLALPDLDR
jgi:nucleotide-binding universal stress UspA family protein